MKRGYCESMKRGYCESMKRGSCDSMKRGSCESHAAGVHAAGVLLNAASVVWLGWGAPLAWLYSPPASLIAFAASSTHVLLGHFPGCYIISWCTYPGVVVYMLEWGGEGKGEEHFWERGLTKIKIFTWGREML